MILPEMLTPKNILFNALKSKLEGQGIDKIILEFFMDSSKYNLYLRSEANGALKIDLTENEINTLKKLFITRINQKIIEKYDKTPEKIMLTYNVRNSVMEVYFTDNEKTYRYEE